MNILVIGLGYFGESLALELAHLGHEVLGVDSEMEVVQRNAPYLTSAVQMDATNLDALRTLDIPSFDTCIVGKGSDLEESVLITLNLLELKARHVIAKALTDQQAKILSRIGADQIVLPERHMGKRLAHMLGRTSQTLDYMNIEGDYNVEEVTAPKEWWEHSLRELNLPKRCDVQVLLVKSGDYFEALPSGDTVIHEGDVLVLFGREPGLCGFGR